VLLLPAIQARKEGIIRYIMCQGVTSAIVRTKQRKGQGGLGSGQSLLDVTIREEL
jgi:hypothetical protein